MNKQISQYFNQYNKIDVDIVFNDKVIVITKLKLGHSKLRELFLGDAQSKIDSNFTIDFHTLKITNPNTNSSSYTQDVINIWTNVLNKTEKRDIVLVCRNPVSAFLSGFYQDTIYAHDIHDSLHFINNPFFIDFINSLKHDDTLKDKFLKHSKKENDIRSLLANIEYTPIISDILRTYLDHYMLNNKFGKAHTKSWIPFIYKLINSKQIDQSKIKLLDMYDASFETQLKNYLNITNPKEIGNYRRSKLEIETLLQIMMTSDYWKTITQLLKEEYNLYIDLKENYKQYHLNYE